MRFLKKLFKKRVEALVQRPPEGGRLGTPPYYEIWGGLESANRSLWVGLWFSMTIAILAMIFVRTLIRRPPVVIGVNDTGQARALAISGRQPPVSEVEIKNFLALFERFFTQLNAYTYESEVIMAFSMMTPEFKIKAAEILKRDGTVDALKANQTKTTLFLTELNIARDTPEIIECHVKGYRQNTSFKVDGPIGEVVFEDTIILKKIPRSAQAPYGVLVHDFKESLFKR